MLRWLFRKPLQGTRLVVPGYGFGRRSRNVRQLSVVTGNKGVDAKVAVLAKCHLPRQVVAERCDDVLVRERQRLRPARAVIEEGVERRLAIPRCVDAATAVEDTGLTLHHELVGRLIRGCVV